MKMYNINFLWYVPSISHRSKFVFNIMECNGAWSNDLNINIMFGRLYYCNLNICLICIKFNCIKLVFMTRMRSLYKCDLTKIKLS